MTPDPSGSQAVASTSLFTEDKLTAKSKAAAARAQNRLTHAQLRELEAEKEKEVIKGFKRLKEQWSALLSGDDVNAEREWVLEAEKLVDMFRETRNLFLTSRVRVIWTRCLRYRVSSYVIRQILSGECFHAAVNGSNKQKPKPMKIEWLPGFNSILVRTLTRLEYKG
jgi:general transcription factor 3C polypeptide 3 (transcription factor C subunit 4)